MSFHNNKTQDFYVRLNGDHKLEQNKLYVLEVQVGGHTYSKLFRGENQDYAQVWLENLGTSWKYGNIVFADKANVTQSNTQDPTLGTTTAKVTLYSTTMTSTSLTAALVEDTTQSAAKDENVVVTLSDGTEIRHYNEIKGKQVIASDTINVAPSYTITLNYNGGTDKAGRTINKVSVSSSDILNVRDQGLDYYKDALAREDYTFVGWFTDAACTNKYAYGFDEVTDNLTLYAGWAKDVIKTDTNVTDISLDYTMSSHVDNNGDNVTADEVNYPLFTVNLDNTIGKNVFYIEFTHNGSTYVVGPYGDAAQGVDDVTKANKLYLTWSKNAQAVDGGQGNAKYLFKDGLAVKNTNTDTPILKYGDKVNVAVYKYSLVSNGKFVAAPSYAQYDANKTLMKSKTLTVQSVADTEKLELTKITDLTPVYKTTSAIKFNFSKVAGAEGYEIVATNAAGVEKVVNCTTQDGAATLVKSVSGLEKGKTYTFKVRAYATVDGEKVYGEYSAPVKKATSVLDQVTGLKAIKKTTTTLKLTWNRVDGATSYKVYDADTGKVLATASAQKGTGTDKIVKTITGLKAGETRQYKVRAFDANGNYSAFSGVYTKATAAK